MAHLYIGCSGWSYPAWQGPFYPKGLERARWLQHYARIFDFVEIDSTFYSIPSLFRVKKWAINTPPSFRFTAKMPKVITHEKAMSNSLRELDLFYSSMAPLREKLLAFLIQLPPSISFKTGFKVLKEFVSVLDARYRYGIEVRHPSWFNDEFYNFLHENAICLAWNQLDAIKAPPVLTTDFAYIRLIGDRSILEQDFGHIQKDRSKEIVEWANELLLLSSSKATKREREALSIGIVAANNHYAGFGPATANAMRKALNLEEAAINKKEQKDLIDFGIGAGRRNGEE
jgi:uncharacterized protein YecE (DUF72 family)